jgi:hypothetical protein
MSVHANDRNRLAMLAVNDACNLSGFLPLPGIKRLDWMFASEVSRS